MRATQTLTRSVLALLLLGIAVSPGTAEAKKKKKVDDVPVVVQPAPPPPDPNAWRATPPTPGAESSWQAPVAETFTLKNGIPVYLVQRPGLPLVSVRLMIEAGRETNPKGKAGLASLTADMLDEGTATRSALQISSDATGLGAELSTSANSDYAEIALDALTGDTLAASLDLLADVALKPKFDSKEFARVQKETLAQLQNLASDPRDIANRQFARQIFGKDHPYGTPSIGDTASVKSLKVADVQAYYKTWYTPANTAIVLSGAISAADAKTMLDARFGAWTKPSIKRPTVAAPATPLKTRVVFIEQKGAVQSILRVGTTGVSRTGPEYWNANLAGTITAGMFSSRINMNLREEHEWSYGAGGGFSDARDFGTFTVRTSVQADKTAEAIDQILIELKAAASKPPADADLKLARDSLLKSLAGNFDTNENTAAAFEQVPDFGLGTDMWQQYVKDANAALPDGIYAAAKGYFAPERQIIVVVGPKTVTIDDKDADGKPIKVDVPVMENVKKLATQDGFEFVGP